MPQTKRLKPVGLPILEGQRCTMLGRKSRSQSLYLYEGKLSHGKGCSCAHYREGQARIYQRGVLRERDEL